MRYDKKSRGITFFTKANLGCVLSIAEQNYSELMDKRVTKNMPKVCKIFNILKFVDSYIKIYYVC